MRRGEIEAPPPRMVTIERLEVVSFDEGAQRAVIDVRCSKGTYVRQIAADLGTATSAGGYCSELRRTEVGEFTVDRAASPERILEQGDGPWMIQPREALPHLPERVLDGRELEDVLHGRMLPGAGETGPVRLVYDRRLVAIGRPDERGLRPAVVLGA
jgi:tRNA pseudouridine55 synthase